MEIDINQLGVKVRDTETIWSINSIDFNTKTVTYYSFGKLVKLSFDDAEFIECS